MLHRADGIRLFYRHVACRHSPMAASVLDATKCPQMGRQGVEGSMAGMRRILFASDFSKASAKAFATAVALAKANHADMTILHVLVPFTPLVPEQYIGGTTLDQLNADARRWSQQQLAKLTDKAKKGGVRAGGLIVW
jgi:hypothetical protein